MPVFHSSPQTYVMTMPQGMLAMSAEGVAEWRAQVDAFNARPLEERRAFFEARAEQRAAIFATLPQHAPRPVAKASAPDERETLAKDAEKQGAADVAKKIRSATSLGAARKLYAALIRATYKPKAKAAKPSSGYLPYQPVKKEKDDARASAEHPQIVKMRQQAAYASSARGVRVERGGRVMSIGVPLQPGESSAPRPSSDSKLNERMGTAPPGSGITFNGTVLTLSGPPAPRKPLSPELLRALEAAGEL